MDSGSELLISADSHVIEPSDLWKERLPSQFRDKAPQYPPRDQSVFKVQEGGWNAKARVKEMAVDGVSGEILYPSLAMDQFGLTDAALQEACLAVYNDWLIEYCDYAPDRLFGVGAISTYRIDNAIREAQRCKDAGLRGLMVWQVPPEELSFATDHYDRFWAAAQEMEMPVSLHILTGAPYGPGAIPSGPRVARTTFNFAVNRKLYHAASGISDLIASGVLERFPRLKIVLVENEVSWLPFVISQWDKYYARIQDSPMTMAPSEYFKRQIFATFFNDPPSRWLFREWGIDNCMWSNDFPHGNSTWPNSRKVIARDLGALSDATREKLLHANVTQLYELPAIVEVA